MENKPWFYKECSKFSYQRKQGKFHWLRNPKQINGDKMHKVFSGKVKETNGINDLETNRKKNITDFHTGVNENKEGYRHTINLVKDEKGFLLVVLHNNLKRWQYYFC
jgi:hypothetical protein